MPTARYLWVQQVAQSPAVRRKIKEVRDRKAQQAASIARAEGVTDPIITTEGTRPRGRPYARIALSARVEFGDSVTKRRRILGRVAQS
jgi:hypothetical protein